MTAARISWIRVTVGGIIWIGLAAAVATGWEEVSGEVAEIGTMLPVGVVAIAVGLAAGSAGWAILQPAHLRRRSFRAFLAAQPAKYLPTGGVALAIGQVGLTAIDKRDRGPVTFTLGLHAAAQTHGAIIVSILLIFLPEVDSRIGLGLLFVAGFGSLVWRRPVILILTKRALRLLHRFGVVGAVPGTRLLWVSTGLSVVTLILSGSAFVLMLGVWTSSGVIFGVVGAFAVSWVAGFLVFFLPSGLGVREAVLVALLPGVGPARVVMVSLLHRFATAVAELLLLAAVSGGVFLRHEAQE